MDTDTDPGQLSGLELAAWRKARCVELVSSGYAHAEIARRVGYAHRDDVHLVLLEALGDKLDDLEEKFRGRASGGDVGAMGGVSKVIQLRRRLLRLYRVELERRRVQTAFGDPLP
jgi:hypothetical protein